VAPIIKPWRG